MESRRRGDFGHRPVFGRVSDVDPALVSVATTMGCQQRPVGLPRQGARPVCCRARDVIDIARTLIRVRSEHFSHHGRGGRAAARGQPMTELLTSLALDISTLDRAFTRWTLARGIP